MDEANNSTPAPSADRKTTPTGPPSRPRGPPLHQLYALPVPIRTFPLPSFYPDNALLSLFHIAAAWLRQAFSPPRDEPSVVHTGVWSPELRAVRVADPEAMQALWTQGFFGKGSLSRSEPAWLKREQIRRGLVEGRVSEQVTDSRRRERFEAKWDRARAEQEAIEQKRAEEAALAKAILNSTPEAPPDPNGVAARAKVEPSGGPRLADFIINGAPEEVGREGAAVPKPPPKSPVGPAELLALPNSASDLAKWQSGGREKGGPSPPANGTNKKKAGPEYGPAALPNGDANGHAVRPSSFSQDPTVTPISNKATKRRKSVRFSPKVESTTFQLSDPPSPSETLASARKALANGAKSGPLREPSDKAVASPSPEPSALEASETTPSLIENKEHLQLTPEEAFFLVFGLGALQVLSPDTGQPLSIEELYDVFRRHSYFPPRIGELAPALEPDDPFVIHYAVYHHFRSLGWVPRPGIKFGVDWLLYDKGPVFSHAEFGLLVLPSYSRSEWKALGRSAPRRSWHWLHGVNRVLAHVLKSMVLVYVDVPPPSTLEGSEGVAGMLKHYKIREVMVRRWSSNRNR